MDWDFISDMALVGGTCFAALAAAIFILSYHRLRWEHTTAGRAIMTMSCAVGGLSWLAALRRLDEQLLGADWHGILTPAVAAAWFFVGITFLWATACVQLGRSETVPDRTASEDAHL